VAADYSTVFIAADALEECQISNGGPKRLLSGMFDLYARTRANIFATSRFTMEVEKEFKGCLSLEICSSDDVVQKYLDYHMFQLPSFVLNNLDLQEEIKTEIIKAVSGMHAPSHVMIEG
jgi:hypothetical protein